MPPSNRASTGRVAVVIRQALRRHRAALGGRPIVLAVSGGPDSLGLLLAAAAVRGRPELVAAHFSHGLRPSADPRAARLVKRVAASLGIALEHGSAHAGPSEEAARDARYGFLAEVAAAHGASAVVTAHTQDDQAETLLLRLTRGAGLRGAGAMRELSERAAGGARLTLLRPLLGVSRAEMAGVCEEAGIEPVHDGSNRRLRYARNRVRSRVMRELTHLNPNAAGALARFAESAQADDALLRTLAAEAIQRHETREDGRVAWRRGPLSELPEPLRARVLASAWEHVAGAGAALSAAKLGAAARLIRGPGGGELALGRGARLVVEQETCALGAVSTDQSPLVAGPLAVPGVTHAGPWVATVSAGAPRELDRATVTGKGWRAALDADAAGAGLRLRARVRGDRFQPLGLKEPVRLQDVLVNAKVPRGERDDLPLVVSDRGIAWVPGVRVAEWAVVTAATRRVVEVSLERGPRGSSG